MNLPNGAADVDLTACDREPIHIPSCIQPHGALAALAESDLTVLQVSDNSADIFGAPPADLLGRAITDVVRELPADPLRELLAKIPPRGEPVLLRALRTGGRLLNVLGHRADGAIVLEFEPTSDPDPSPRALHPTVAQFITKVQGVPSVDELARLMSAEVRRVTGFDRALVYRFDPNGTGVVVGEDGNGRLPSYRDHRFPASDIPKQARELYRTNRLRLIPDAAYRPAALVPVHNPLTGRPLDLSHSSLRSVSPVHVEYMRNMRTAASMSVSVLKGGDLWGLVVCHHHAPRSVPFEVRTVCDLLAQVFALQVAAREHVADYERRVELKSALNRLLAHMAAADDYVRGLLDHPDDLLSFVGATGAAVVGNGRCDRVGAAPSEAQVRRLTDWLFGERKRDVFHTNALASEFPEAAAYPAVASGLLGISVSKLNPTMVLWFRPEVIETIRWGGDPRRPTDLGGVPGRLHPRKSFETWSQTVRNQAVPWLPSETEAAAELRNAVLGIVLRRAEEMAALNVELQRSNKELEAFSYSVSHDLRAPLRHIVGYAEMLKESAAAKLAPGEQKYVDTIIESSVYAGQLVDALLSFSRMGRAALDRGRVEMGALVSEVRRGVTTEFAGRRVRWTVAALPAVEGDAMMLKLAVRNLLTNALKYTKTRAEAEIEIGCREEGAEYVFSVRDNGVGFDMRYRDKLFGVFQRLHRWEDFEGTGIGLANVRRIVERHGGRTWAEGEVDKGATFYFTLPVPNTREG
ncbi:ATP-binding protein [Frigoriglobus tundricola]|uniref:histidine kinase n=1 Tax=Frigoriglobus tundricola TaxID=2774151 RepID=A0A6M5YYH2_9BACT|nr:ATP-binding protein [Frigoriglobus tundricola]QJW98263.1 Phytochrome, two-component sensor histidine kinase [Frigoriglobus tundricola]